MRRSDHSRVVVRDSRLPALAQESRFTNHDSRI
jgi:hypothetical protein